MMRRLAVLALRGGTLVLALVLGAPRAEAVPPPPMRYQNFHGSSCQTTNATDPHTYSTAGITIPTTATSMAVLSCPVSWSLDATTSALQEIQFTVTFSGAPTGGSSPFDPGCSFMMNTSSAISGGLFQPPLTGTIGSGTSTPTFIYSWTAPAGTSYIFYENVIGSLLYCAAVPAGVTLNGYSVITCVSTSSANCAPIPGAPGNQQPGTRQIDDKETLSQ